MSALVAEFDSEAGLVAAAYRLREEGLTVIEAYTPYPIEALDAILPRPRRALPALVFAAGMLGLAGGFLMQWYGAAGDPMKAGRPLYRSRSRSPCSAR
jgi:hypothetical protein